VLEAEEIERERALLAVERAKRIVPFGSMRDRTSLLQEVGHDFGWMALRPGVLAWIELPGRDRHERRHQSAIGGIRMRDEKVGQLHQVAVGVVDQPFAGIAHGDLAYVQPHYTTMAKRSEFDSLVGGARRRIGSQGLDEMVGLVAGTVPT